MDHNAGLLSCFPTLSSGAVMAAQLFKAVQAATPISMVQSATADGDS